MAVGAKSPKSETPRAGNLARDSYGQSISVPGTMRRTECSWPASRSSRSERRLAERGVSEPFLPPRDQGHKVGFAPGAPQCGDFQKRPGTDAFAPGVDSRSARGLVEHHVSYPSQLGARTNQTHPSTLEVPMSSIVSTNPSDLRTNTGK